MEKQAHIRLKGSTRSKWLSPFHGKILLELPELPEIVYVQDFYDSGLKEETIYSEPRHYKIHWVLDKDTGSKQKAFYENPGEVSLIKDFKKDIKVLEMLLN